MGIRCLTIVVQDKQYKVAQYGNSGGYPEGQGLVVLNFLKECNLSKFKKQISKCKFIEDDEFYKNAYEELNIKPDNDFITYEESDRFNKKYPQLSDDIGASVLNYILNNDNVLLENNIGFAMSPFCEWAYLIDLDSDVLEIYVGDHKGPFSSSDRFYSKDNKPNDCPIKRIMTFDINSLPYEDDFVNSLKLD